MLSVFIDLRNLPVLLHCYDGKRATGVVVMCLRKLQNWNLSIAISEFVRYTRGEAGRAPEFAESFRGPVCNVDILFVDLLAR